MRTRACGNATHDDKIVPDTSDAPELLTALNNVWQYIVSNELRPRPDQVLRFLRLLASFGFFPTAPQYRHAVNILALAIPQSEKNVSWS